MVAVLIGVNPNPRNKLKMHVIRNKIKTFLFILFEEIPLKTSDVIFKDSYYSVLFKKMSVNCQSMNAAGLH